MSSTEAIPYFVQKFSQEPLLESATVKTGPVKVVAAREQIDTMTITVSHWRLDGSADPAIFSTTLPLVARGEAASRFNYCAKASKSERNRGCEELPDVIHAASNAAKAAAKRGETYDKSVSGINRVQVVKNNHPTVKPLSLMKYLCQLTRTPTGGIVLDPFAGSGTTLLAAKNTGREYVGIEQNPEYFEIIKARLGMK